MIIEFRFSRIGLSDHKDNDYSAIFSAIDKTTYSIIINGSAIILKITIRIIEIIISKNRGQLALIEKSLNLSDINLMSDTIMNDNKTETPIKVYEFIKKSRTPAISKSEINGKTLTKIPLAGTGSP